MLIKSDINHDVLVSDHHPLTRRVIALMIDQDVVITRLQEHPGLVPRTDVHHSDTAIARLSPNRQRVGGRLRRELSDGDFTIWYRRWQKGGTRFLVVLLGAISELKPIELDVRFSTPEYLGNLVFQPPFNGMQEGLCKKLCFCFVI